MFKKNSVFNLHFPVHATEGQIRGWDFSHSKVFNLGGSPHVAILYFFLLLERCFKDPLRGGY